MIENVQPFIVRRFSPSATMAILKTIFLKSNPKSYSFLSDQQREKLISLVYNQQLPIKKAAMTSGINYTTAKSILKVFREKGRSTKAKTRLRKNSQLQPDDGRSSQVRSSGSNLRGGSEGARGLGARPRIDNGSL
eukprot:TRINITY_DN4300_c0_g1_i10.p1 TRINITY_DN4300_c0_g1~~TRINITY_DN4300_c0_g1_i10.p1  ORF type:complete len:135 (+),score=17.68 TRINITY_DN4300_c0_g1_i10:191-595(+)